MVILILSIAAGLALVVANGVLVAAEFAIVRVRRTRLEELVGQGRHEARQAIELVDEMGEYLTTTQVGITAASLGVGWLGEGAFARLFTLALPGYSSALVHGARNCPITRTVAAQAGRLTTAAMTTPRHRRPDHLL